MASANLLGYEDAATLPQETLDEEGEADKKLTELAETAINVEAGEADEEEVAPSNGRAKPKAGGRK